MTHSLSFLAFGPGYVARTAGFAFLALGAAQTASAAATCPTDEQLDVLADYFEQLNSSSGLFLGHPSQVEAVGTLMLPNWDLNMATYFFLLMPCSGPMLYDDWCDGQMCWRTECTEPGASWAQHAELQSAPVSRLGWTYGESTSELSWSDDGSNNFTLLFDGAAEHPSGDDYSYIGVQRSTGAKVQTLVRMQALLGASEDVTMQAQVDFGTGASHGDLWVGKDLAGILVDTATGFEWTGAGVCP